MKKIKNLLVLIFITLTTLGLTKYEATIYGSQIIICENGVIKDILIRYWHLIDIHKEPYVFDSFTKLAYPIKDCQLYYCSPDPGRMKPCIIK